MRNIRMTLDEAGLSRKTTALSEPFEMYPLVEELEPLELPELNLGPSIEVSVQAVTVDPATLVLHTEQPSRLRCKRTFHNNLRSQYETQESLVAFTPPSSTEAADSLSYHETSQWPYRIDRGRPLRQHTEDPTEFAPRDIRDREARRCVQKMFSRFDIQSGSASPSDDEKSSSEPGSPGDTGVLQETLSDYTPPTPPSSRPSPSLCSLDDHHTFPLRASTSAGTDEAPRLAESRTSIGTSYSSHLSSADDIQRTRRHEAERDKFRSWLNDTSREVGIQTFPSQHPTLKTRMRDRCPSVVSWFEEKCDNFGKTRSKISLGLASSSRDRTIGIFDRTPSKLGTLIKSNWGRLTRRRTSTVSSST